ncbi:hypothetical protein [Glycomyces sp. L485]|uniref:hypothetical protein n=1 Tax=Glycomyces sp. L485 TaxID=2909235 RepID=UPI001F4AE181|nr:hypothetical protein [Glycomyces sp. L485]
MRWRRSFGSGEDRNGVEAKKIAPILQWRWSFSPGENRNPEATDFSAVWWWVVPELRLRRGSQRAERVVVGVIGLWRRSFGSGEDCNDDEYEFATLG